MENAEDELAEDELEEIDDAEVGFEEEEPSFPEIDVDMDPDLDLDEDLPDEDLADEDLADDDLTDDLEDDLPDDLGAEDAKPAEEATYTEEEDDDEDEPDPDDVEASLDVILKDRLVIEDAQEEDDDEETPEPDERGEGATLVVPKRPDEFVCQSCFLVKHPSQLADPVRMLCRDCV